MAKAKPILLDVAGREVKITSPDKVYFPETENHPAITKREVIEYYQAVGDGALRGIANRPFVLKRYVDGITKPFFFQKRAPQSRPEWVDTVTITFPSGRTADEVVIRDLATLLWAVNLGCIDLNPHASRTDDLDHPDELRVDLDPGPGVPWDQVRQVALVVRDVLTDHGLVGWPKTSGSRGIHVLARVERKWGFDELRRAALALARDVERRVPALATSKWWKEERHGVFLDYNQNAKDRTVASAYSLRPVPDAWVSAPLRWDEVASCELSDFTLQSMPARFAELGDLHAGIDEAAGDLSSLLALSAAHEAEGLGDAPWPPHYDKGEDEPRRVQPSRRAKPSQDPKSGPKSGTSGKSGGRVPKAPLVTVAKSADKDDALAGLERWKQRHPGAAEHVREADILVDAMRGRYTTWTRIRVNLRNVPEDARPPEEPPDPDYDPRRKPAEPA